MNVCVCVYIDASVMYIYLLIVINSSAVVEHTKVTHWLVARAASNEAESLNLMTDVDLTLSVSSFEHIKEAKHNDFQQIKSITPKSSPYCCYKRGIFFFKSNGDA